MSLVWNTQHQAGCPQLGGYSDERIQNDVFRVVFEGNGFLHKSAVDYYALVRAAELTVQNGRAYFRVFGANAGVPTDVRRLNIPGQTLTPSKSYAPATARATSRSYGASVSPAPNYSAIIQKPTATIDIQTLPGRIHPCINAYEVLQGAVEKKLKLESATLEILRLKAS